MSETNALRAGDSGVLYVVATPIGNLEDVTRRAVSVLSQVGLIAAEDTRRTRSLLAAVGVAAPEFVVLHEHNEDQASARVMAALERGLDVALVSDAGTPLLSDPGFTLVRACFERDLPVRPVPGPSALACALSVCPLPTSNVRFLGFLPARTASRRARLEAATHEGPCVFFEAPHRIRACLADLAEIAPGQRLFVGREMTKKFESYLCDLPENIAATLDLANQYKGEFVCVFEGPQRAAAGGDSAESQRVMEVLCRELPPAQAARMGAALLGGKRRELYHLALALRGDRETPG